MRRLVRSRCAGLLALAGLVAGSCDSTSGSGASSIVVENGAEPTQSFLGKLASAPFETAYSGVRRVELRQDVVGAPNVLEYTEQVVSDGQGKFALEILEVLSSGVDAELLRIQHGPRQRFHYCYRDVGIHDLARALESYTIRVRDESGSVAGVACVELEVRSRREGGGTYRFLVDPRTGLVLGSEERSHAGQLVRRMEFESIEMDADVSGYELSEWRMERVTVQAEGNGPALGFDVLEPTLPPTGYTLEETSAVVDPEGDVWARLEYGDGIERVFLMHGEPVDSGLPGGASLGRVDEMQLGPWNVITGRVKGYPLLVMGKVPTEDLLVMLQSAL